MSGHGAAPAAPSSGGGESFVGNLFRPVTDKLTHTKDEIFNKGKNAALSTTTARADGAKETQIGDALVASMTDAFNGTVKNVLSKTGIILNKLADTGGNAVMAIANPISRLLTLHPILALKEAAKATVIVPTESLDGITSTLWTSILATRDAIEGCLRRNIDRVSTQIGRVPIAGPIAKGTVNVLHRIYGTPLDLIYWTRDQLSTRMDGVFKWIRAKVPLGGGGSGGGGHAAAPAAAH